MRWCSCKPWLCCVGFLPGWLAAGAAMEQPPGGNPDRVVLVEARRVVAVYSGTIAEAESGRRAWFRVDYPVAPGAEQGAVRRWVWVRGLFDCDAGRWRAEEQVTRPPEGEGGFATGPAWQPAEEAAAAAVLSYVCSYAGPAREPGETIYLM